jgi:hypothetical protein
VSVVCCQVDVSATGRPNECGVSECDREASNMKRPWPARGCSTMREEEVGKLIHYNSIMFKTAY